MSVDSYIQIFNELSTEIIISHDSHSAHNGRIIRATNLSKRKSFQFIFSGIELTDQHLPWFLRSKASL